MKKTLLITGGTGFLGRDLAIRLRDQYHVVISDRNNAQNERAQRTTGCKSFPLDICDIESVRDAPNRFKPSHVIHAAASNFFFGMTGRFPKEAIDVNVRGSQSVTRVCIDSDHERAFQEHNAVLSQTAFS